MRTIETKEGVAELLRDLIAYAHVTNHDVAEMLGVHEKTIRNWTEGYSQPSTSDVVRLFRLLNVPMLPFILGSLHDREAQDDELIHDYIDRLATGDELRTMRYNLTNKHGSSVSSQLELVSMLNHMKLEYRLMVAKMVLNLWEIAEQSGGLQHMDDTPPDVEKVRTAVIKSHMALKEGRNSYTDI